jgi:hypothetical protein
MKELLNKNKNSTKRQRKKYASKLLNTYMSKVVAIFNARGSVVGRGTMQLAGKSLALFPMRLSDF